ncbi:MAG: hypothetical protein HFH93_03135 [Lachnospiraceae bacterium]|nr:hypothetical protein [Lachnospiraceae bacterium]
MDNTANNTPEAAPLYAGQGCLSGSTVKIIAVAAMFIDHAAAVVIARYLIDGIQTAIASGTAGAWEREHLAVYSVYHLMRDIGRLGFPIFCFLLVEGFQRTRNVRKYALRLFMFALISELPFNLAICGQIFNSSHQNVYFTLLLGLLALCSFRFLESPGNMQKLPAPLRMVFLVTGVLLPAVFLRITDMTAAMGQEKRFIACVLAVGVVLTALFSCGIRHGLRQAETLGAHLTALALCMTAADLMCTDYAGMGVLTVWVMYLFRRYKTLAMAAGCAVLSLMTLTELPAFFALIPIALYNGRRGLKMKYIFYVFYPVHLLLLYVVAVLTGLGNVALL